MKKILGKLRLFLIFFWINEYFASNATSNSSLDSMDIISKNKESLKMNPLPKENFLNGLQISRKNQDISETNGIIYYGYPQNSFLLENVRKSENGPAVIDKTSSLIILQVLKKKIFPETNH